MLGDSLTAALALEEPRTLCSQLEVRRNDDASRQRYEVLNFGVPLPSLTRVLRAAAPSDSSAVREEWLEYGGTMRRNERANALAAEALTAFLRELDRAGGRRAPGRSRGGRYAPLAQPVSWGRRARRGVTRPLPPRRP